MEHLRFVHPWRHWALLWLTAGLVRADVRVVGTDLLGLDFAKGLYRVAVARQLTLALALDGTRPGVADLRAGRADAALLVLSEGEVLPAEIADITIGYHRAVVLVPAACPIRSITLAQLSAVFAQDSGVILARWGELGAGGEWAAQRMTPLAPADGSSFALELFRHVALHDRPVASGVRSYEGAAELPRWFGGESRPLAIASAIPPDAAVKALPVSTRTGQPAFLPSLENLHSGDYPLRLPVRFAFRRTAASRIRPLLPYLLSAECAAELERAGLAPLPPRTRAQQLVTPDRA